MTLRNHYWKVLLELMMLFGVMVFAMVVVQQLTNPKPIALESFWALALLAGAIGFRFESFINFHNLDEHKMRINYLVSSVLADITLLVLLYKFTSGGEQFAGKGWAILGIYFVFKGAFYISMHLKSLHSAKLINKALRRHRVDI